MSMTNGLTTDSAPPPGAVDPGVPDAPVSVPVGTAPGAVPADPLDTELPTTQAVFDRGYVESIRREGQRYRTEAQAAAQRAQQYDEVYGAYEDRDRQVWFDLARTWADDPIRAARVMQQIASGVLSEEQEPMEPSMDGGNVAERQEPPGEFLTAAQAQELIEQGFQSREQRAAEQKAIDDVMADVRANGFDPDSAEGFMVLWRANHETNGDVKAAADMVRSYRQTIIDEYVQGRTAGRVARPSSGGVQATSAGEPITNLEDARKAADNFLRERRGA